MGKIPYPPLKPSNQNPATKEGIGPRKEVYDPGFGSNYTL